jgi:hypothetical protein
MKDEGRNGGKLKAEGNEKGKMKNGKWLRKSNQQEPD